jgi:hypothetical protein
MVRAVHACRSAEKAHQGIARGLCGGIWARLVAAAGAVHFARCDASQPDLDAVAAEYRSIAVPQGNGTALEALPAWHDGG